MTALPLKPRQQAAHDAETIQRQIDEQQRQRSLAQRQAAANARKRWDRLQLTGHHPYLDRKGIGVHGIRFGSDQHGSFVAVPMRDASGQMVGLQRIYDQPLPSIDTNFDFGVTTWRAKSVGAERADPTIRIVPGRAAQGRAGRESETGGGGESAGKSREPIHGGKKSGGRASI